MIFEYCEYISPAPDGTDFVLTVRPEIPIRIIGPNGSVVRRALVDTGSDSTILPKSVADYLGVSLETASGLPAKLFGGHPIQMLIGDVMLRLESDAEAMEWLATVHFYDFPNPKDETVILGHAGFLDYFTAIFDGKEATLTLIANDDLPVVS